MWVTGVGGWSAHITAHIARGDNTLTGQREYKRRPLFHYTLFCVLPPLFAFTTARGPLHERRGERPREASTWDGGKARRGGERARAGSGMGHKRAHAHAYDGSRPRGGSHQGAHKSGGRRGRRRAQRAAAPPPRGEGTGPSAVAALPRLRVAVAVNRSGGRTSFAPCADTPLSIIFRAPLSSVWNGRVSRSRSRGVVCEPALRSHPCSRGNFRCIANDRLISPNIAQYCAISRNIAQYRAISRIIAQYRAISRNIAAQGSSVRLCPDQVDLYQSW